MINMLRILVFVCCLRLSVGAILSGQVLLDGKASKSVRIPAGSTATISLQDTTLADASAIIIKELIVKNISSLPYAFEMVIPDHLPKNQRYSLSVRITHDFDILYLNDEHVGAPVSGDSPVTVNIPVKQISSRSESVQNDQPLFDMEDRTWPELVGQKGTSAVEEIKKQTGFTDVFTVLENSPMTMDYRTDRVRVIVDSNGIVTVTPRTG